MGGRGRGGSLGGDKRRLGEGRSGMARWNEGRKRWKGREKVIAYDRIVKRRIKRRELNDKVINIGWNGRKRMTVYNMYRMGK